MAFEKTNLLTLAQAHDDIPLWGDLTPPYHVKGAVFPTLKAYLAEGSKYAVVIFPGGGYFQLSVQSEGIAVAKALNEKGISAFVVTYRYSPCDGRAILADGRRAMRFVRHYADVFDVDQNKLALMGFSAGGHLAMCVAVHGEGQVFDIIDREDSHPNACVLAYPVVTLGDGTFPTMPPIFLAERQDDADAIARYSLEHCLSSMPPTFLWYSKNDTAVDYVKNAEALYAGLSLIGTPTVCHGYSDGAHGIGLGRSFPECAGWLDLAVSFMDNIFIK